MAQIAYQRGYITASERDRTLAVMQRLGLALWHDTCNDTAMLLRVGCPFWQKVTPACVPALLHLPCRPLFALPSCPPAPWEALLWLACTCWAAKPLFQGAVRLGSGPHRSFNGAAMANELRFMYVQGCPGCVSWLCVAAIASEAHLCDTSGACASAAYHCCHTKLGILVLQ